MRLLLLLLVVCLPNLCGAAPDEEAPIFTPVADTGLPDVGKTFGGVWIEVDGNGLPDLFLSRHGAGYELYLGRGDGRFELQETDLGLPGGPFDNHGTAACDFDTDGDWDLYLSAGTDLGRSHDGNDLWIQEAPGVFLGGLPPGHLLQDPQGKGRGGLWLDLDGRGRPELLLLHYLSPVRLFHHDGELWQDWSERVCLERPRPRHRPCWASTAAAGDLDGDGRTDLVIAGAEWGVLRNEGEGRLADVTAAAGLPLEGEAPAQVVLADVDEDGDLDLLAAVRFPARLDLSLNESGPADEGGLRFAPAVALDLPLDERIDSVAVADLDNDGHLDLYVSQFAGKLNRPNLAARGRGDGTFEVVSAAWGAAGPVASLPSGVWAVDLDADGDLDLALINGAEHHPEREGLVEIYRNDTPACGLTLRLEPAEGPVHGLSAVVELRVGERTITRWVRSEGNPWNSTILPLHFGVGSAHGPFPAVVRWPHGALQEIELPAAGAAYVLREGEPPAKLR